MVVKTRKPTIVEGRELNLAKGAGGASKPAPSKPMGGSKGGSKGGGGKGGGGKGGRGC